MAFTPPQPFGDCPQHAPAGDAPQGYLYNNTRHQHHDQTTPAASGISNSLSRSGGLDHLSPMAPEAASIPLPRSPSSSLLSPPHGPGSSSPRTATTLGQPGALRKSTSTTSLRSERRLSTHSTPGLQKRSSVASLRSAHTNQVSGSPRPSLSRRSSSNLRSSSPNGMAAAVPKVPLPTAASIAADHFKKEVDLHQTVDLQSKSIVILHDACYGHRFSRPRTSKAALGTIVERPERIRASVLGVSAAFVRLARRHAGGQYAPHPDLNVHQLPAPPFQIRRTERSLALSSPAVTHVHGTKWMDDLKTMCDAAESRLALNGRELVRPRSAGKDDPAAGDPQFHEGDLYLCAESLRAFEGALGGVCEGVDAVFGSTSTKRAFVCVRPPGHHCSSGHPSGFCWINNVHVGISYAAMTHGLTHAVILDFDLHHGDGSQEIAWEQNSKAIAAAKNAGLHKKTMIGYFSLHDINSYPCEMGDVEKVRNASVCIDKAHGQSIWNVHLEPWRTPSEFWELYATKYAVLLEKARAFLKTHTERLASIPNGPPPKAAIFLSAGFDASEWEGAGMQRHKVNVPTDFYAKFTADVVRMAEEAALGVDGRIISVLEGGYSDRALMSGVMSHLAGLADSPRAEPGESINHQINRLASEMTDRLGLSGTPNQATTSHPTSPAFDTEWWTPSLLEELEAVVYPAPIAPVVKIPKSGPTYFAPTQSFAAKVVIPPRDRKLSGSHETESSPPLPPVSWTTATHELCKVLIPSDRQTMSCRPEDLNAEASRIRRERQAQTVVDHAAATSEASEEKRMQLRTRKPKSSLPSTPRMETPKTPAGRSSRRTTIDAVTGIVDTSAESSPALDRSTRRKSATSNSTSNGANGAGKLLTTPSRETTVKDVRTEPRPSTSASMRSTVSTATRKTTGSRGGTPKRSTSPRKMPPVPRVPSAFLHVQSASSSNAVPSIGGGESDSAHLGDANIDHGNDLDGLTAEVKKLSIKLKVPSPEENAVREQRKAAVDGRGKAPVKGAGTTRSPRKPSATASARSVKPKPVSQLQLTAGKRPDDLSLAAVPRHPREDMHEEQQQQQQQQQNIVQTSMMLPPLDTSLALPTPDLYSTTSTQGSWQQIERNHHHHHQQQQQQQEQEQGQQQQMFNSSSPRMIQSPFPNAMSPPLTPGIAHVNQHSQHQHPHQQQRRVFSPPISASQGKHGLTVMTSSSPIPFAPSSGGGQRGDTSRAGSRPSTSVGEMSMSLEENLKSEE